MAIIKEKPDIILDNRKYYKVETVAKITGKHPETIRRMFRFDKFPKFKIGARYYIIEKNLQNYIIGRSMQSLTYEEFLVVVNKVITVKLKEMIPEIRKTFRECLNTYDKEFKRKSLSREEEKKERELISK